jgi:uncharacterized membrane protein YgcG
MTSRLEPGFPSSVSPAIYEEFMASAVKSPRIEAGMKSFLVVVAVLSFTASLPAEPIATLKPTGRVNDFAYAFDDSSRAKLDAACREIDEKANAQVVIVTVNSLDGLNIYDYSVDLFKQWGIGTKPSNRGVMILLAVQDHRYRITVGSGLDSILKEGNVAGFGLEAVPYLRRGDYSSAAMLMTSRVERVIAEDAGVTLTAFESLSAQPTSTAPPVYPTVEPAQREASNSSNAGMIFVIVCLVVAIPVYLLIQRGKRRLAYQSVLINRDPNDDIYIGSRPTSIFPNPAIAASNWNSTNTSSSPSSFAGNDSAMNSSASGSSCDTSGSFGGGDTSGSGAGGSW